MESFIVLIYYAIKLRKYIIILIKNSILHNINYSAFIYFEISLFRSLF